MIVNLESRAGVATTALTSSFLPKCTQLLAVKVAHRPPSKTSFHGVVASTKQKKKGRKTPTRDWAYEHFMVLWDEVFEHCCTDPVKATEIRNLSCKGLAKHGRGCVLVFQEVQTRPRGPDPRKAPSEEDVAEEPHDNADRVVVENGSNEIIDVAAREHKDSMLGTGDSGDKVIDIEEIIREAQDVYSFYSDDEDELDDAADNNDSLLDMDDKEGDTNSTEEDVTEGDTNPTDSLIILDDDTDKDGIVGLDGKNADSNLNRTGRDAEQNLDDNSDASCSNASERFDNHESPLFLDDDGQAKSHVLNSLSTDTQYEKDLYAINDPIFVDETGQSEDNNNDAVHCTQSDIREGQNDYPNFNNESHSISSLRESMVLEGSVSGMEEINVSTANFLEEGTTSIKGGSTHAATSPIVELLDESLEADTVESSESVAIEKANQYQVNEDTEDEEVQLTTQQMLYACMRGMDRTRLMSLTANFDFEAERYMFRRKMAVIDVKTADAGGEEPYNPTEEELVLLLHLRIDGKPAYGADVVVAYRDQRQIIGVEEDSWKLRGKYRDIFC
ncbi:hypothetical protein GOP47_0012462 [Adiantum capillus-veneris]|uniref:Uncharacterized protein n=1 Tax=Adiantum capillus-veneris TaxID=13818 RepID=A0A9D4ZGV3_ADICA|nr:hypothetical protein GOP47_0012462 [Adiantum capillus-veneris]